MTKNRGYNSAFFITTLSVYLGLVLVGASPSVLAQQAALTQRFEVRHEIDVEDDKDKKPDQYLLRSGRDFGLILKSYSLALSHFAERASFPDYRQLAGVARADAWVDLEKLSPSLLKISALEKLEIGSIQTSFVSNIVLEPGPPDSVQSIAGLDQRFEPSAMETGSTLEQKALRNALLESENEQVLVVTSLPRGSLNALVN